MDYDSCYRIKKIKCPLRAEVQYYGDDFNGGEKKAKGRKRGQKGGKGGEEMGGKWRKMEGRKREENGGK